MTRTEYIRALTQALSACSIVEVATILTRCDRQFQQAAAAGLSEDEAAALLGEPAAFACGVYALRHPAPVRHGAKAGLLDHPCVMAGV